jgi:hypothetical protein
MHESMSLWQFVIDPLSSSEHLVMVTLAGKSFRFAIAFQFARSLTASLALEKLSLVFLGEAPSPIDTQIGIVALLCSRINSPVLNTLMAQYLLGTSNFIRIAFDHD